MIRERVRERIKELIKERAKKGPVLKRLREELFKAATEILDPQQLMVRLREDLKACENYALIISPFLSEDSVKMFSEYREVSDCLKRGVKMIVMTRPAERGEMEDKARRGHNECIKLLKEAGFSVIEKSKLHFKAAIFDDSVIYIGSINMLSIIMVKYIPEDYMLRFESEALVDEIIDRVITKEEFEKYLGA